MGVFSNEEWLAKAEEEPVLDPAREIVDAHHHLWPSEAMGYGIDAFLQDTRSGHNVVQTVFMECGAAYDDAAPDHLEPVGETRYVAAAAERAEALGGARIDGIVAHADLTLPGAQLEELLDAHEAAAGGRFRGIRHGAASAPEGAALAIPGPAKAGLMGEAAFREGLARLGERGLSFDTWLYHFQINELREAAASAPGTTVVIDHFGTPLGVDRWTGKRDDIFAAWKDDIAALAELPNVRAKLGGLAMPDNGWGWNDRDAPPGSEEIADAHRPWHLHTISCFSAERCLFESNFPVDRLSVGYRTLWNAFKRIADDLSEADKARLFSGSARDVYRLESPPATA